MVWGAFSVPEMADLIVMEGKQNSARYINVLEKSLSTFVNRLDTNKAIFQLNNVAIHTSKLTKDWFKTNKKIGLAHLVTRFKPKRKFVGNFIKKSIKN